MQPTIFCPECQTYLGPAALDCPACNWARRPEEQLPKPGRPAWSAQLDGAVVSRPVIQGKRIYFSWGARHGGGGVLACDRLSGEKLWDFQTPHGVEGGVTQFSDHLYFGTLGFLGSGAEVYCLNQEDGSVVWREGLSAGIWHAPLLDEARLFIGTDDGRIHCLDNRNGVEVSQNQPVTLKRGRMWLCWVDEGLLAISKSGQILALNPMGLRKLWHQPLEAGCEISSAPAVVGERVFFGGKGGKLLSLGVRKKKIEVVADGLTELVAAPAYVDGVLYAGSHDHYLHAFDIRTGLESWKSQEFAHSISSVPFVADGLVVVCVNQVGVYLLDSESGETIWEYPIGGNVKLFSDPLMRDGLIYVGADDGMLVALPWHLGQYEWAAAHLRQRGQYHQAGIYYVTAAHTTHALPQREQFYKDAESCWDKSGEPELAARLWEGLGRERKAAEAYCRAAEARRGRDNSAAEYYYQASRLYWRLGDYADTDRCFQEAAILGKWPRIRLIEWNNPKMVQGKPGMVSFRAENNGYGDAKNLYFSLGGSLLQPVDCKVIQPLSPDSYFEITLDIVPTRIKDNLKVEVQYVEEPHREVPFTAYLIPPMEIEAIERKIIEAGDMIGGKLRIVNKRAEAVDIRIGDQVMSEVEIVYGDDEDSSGQEVGHNATEEFIWPDSPVELNSDERVLIQVEDVKDEYTVPSAHWAILLADEAAIATVAPGRHTRKDFLPLRFKMGNRHKPAWKAVVFSGSPFRLFYRLGPFRTQEGIQVGVECGLTAEFDDRKPFDLWKGILGDRDQLTTTDLARWLQGEIIGTLVKWVAGQPEEMLSPGFAHREKIMLSLQEELRQTHARYGICLQDPLWWLNFIIPGREHVDNIREQVYWQQQEGQARSGDIKCSKCGANIPPEAQFCNACGGKF